MMKLKMRTVILLSWRRAMYCLWAPLGQVLIWCCFFVKVFVWDQMLTRAAVLIFMYFFYLDCKDRENVTCENTSSCCECAIRRCWCNNVNTGKFIAWYGYLTVCLVIRKPYAKVWGAAYVTPYQKKMDIEQILLITLSFTPSPHTHTHFHICAIFYTIKFLAGYKRKILTSWT